MKQANKKQETYVKMSYKFPAQYVTAKAALVIMVLIGVLISAPLLFVWLISKIGHL